MENSFLAVVQALSAASQKGTLQECLGIHDRMPPICLSLSSKAILLVMKAIVGQITIAAEQAFEAQTGGVKSQAALEELNQLIGIVLTLLAAVKHDHGSCNQQTQELLCAALAHKVAA